MKVSNETIKQSVAFIENKIPIEVLIEFSQIVCVNLVNIYGVRNIREDILSIDGNSKINNDITNIFEVGTLFHLYNRNLISSNNNELFLSVLGVSFMINHLLAGEFIKEGILPQNIPVVYSISAQQELVQRTIKLCKECYLNYNFITKLIGNRSVSEMTSIYLDKWYIDPIRTKPI